MTDTTDTTALPAEFNLVRVFLNDGTAHEAVWTGEVWWLRHGAVLTREQCGRWESIPPIEGGVYHERYEMAGV